MARKSRHPETIVLHAGWRADPTTGAVAPPIYQTTSFQFQSTEHASNLFALKELGNIYTRLGNPTTAILEERIAALEGGAAAVALASGQAASAFSIQNLARAGDNVVSSTDLYGGTWNLFANTLKDLGIEVRFADPADPESFRRATDDARGILCGDPAQSEAGGLPDRRGGGHRPTAGHPPDHGQHSRPAALPTAVPRRGRRRLFDHQVYRRAWHLNRRGPD